MEELPPSRPSQYRPDQFVSDLLSRIGNLIDHLDSQLNILIGISTAIFVFAIATWREDSNFAMLVMAVFASITAIIGLIAVHPPKSMRKRGQPESVMYNRRIASHATFHSYFKEIREATESTNSIMEEYTKEIYNICKFYYRPKRVLFHAARTILFVGMVVSLVIFLLQTYFDLRF